MKTAVLKIQCKAGWTDAAGEFVALFITDGKRRFGGAGAAGLTGFINLSANR
jgi:hypothetical protein